MRRAAKGSASYYKRKLDAEIGALVRSRGACERCGKTDTLQCAHIVPRTNHALRYDPINLLCLCYKCHIHFAHKDPIAFQAWLADKLPHVLDYVQKNRHLTIHRKAGDYKELLETVRAIQGGDKEKINLLLVGEAHQS